MRIISYNVNGLRAAVKKGLIDWLQKEQPDIVCVQETKLQPDQFPTKLFEEIGYKAFLYSAERKGYSGVAIITRLEPDNIVYGMSMENYDKEGRFIRADFGDISVVSVYHPNGASGDVRLQFKMKWLTDFQDYIKKLQLERPNIVLCGDYNIAHEPIDIHDPIRNAKYSGFLPEERAWMSQFLAEGYIDSFRKLHPEEQTYSWWSYRFKARDRNKGWRIDYCITTPSLENRIENATILTEIKQSDHCPIAIDIKTDSKK